MNKAELVEALAAHYDGSKAEASRALNAVVQTITRSTVAGEKVAITGFGVFERVERPARMVRNPRTGERKEAPATAVPRFRAGTELKAYVAGQRDLPAVSTAAPAGSTPRSTARRPARVAAVAAATEPATPKSSSTTTTTSKARAKSSDSKGPSKKVDSKKVASKKADSKKADSKKAASKKDGGKKNGKKAKSGK